MKYVVVKKPKKALDNSTPPIYKKKPVRIVYNYHNLGKAFGDNRFKTTKGLDATMKYLRDKAVSQQDKQALKSKRIAGIAYLGLNQVGDLRFACRSEDGKETYIQSIRFYDFRKRKPRGRDDILRMMRESDVGVYCNDPSFLYWGAAYNATVGKYNIAVENRPPTTHLELKRKFVLCKHLIAVLRAVPFYWNNMVKDFMIFFRLNDDKPVSKEPVVKPEDESTIKNINKEKQNTREEVKKETKTPSAEAPAKFAKPAEAQSTKREVEE